MRYWFSNGDGNTYGPYEIGQLHGFATEGRLNAQSQLCAENSTQWMPASSVLTVPPAPGPIMNPHSPTAWVQLGLFEPIAITLCCCLIGGIFAIVYTTRANAKGAAGDIAGATADAATAKSWKTWSMIIGVVLGIIQLILYAAANQSRGY